MPRRLLRNATVLAWDDDAQTTRILRHTSILIENDRIAAITPSADDAQHHNESTEITDMAAKILSPGFINTHMHSWQSAFRTMAPNVYIAQYFPWLSQMGSAKESFSPEDVYLSSLAAFCEGVNAGVTSFVDHASVNWSKEVIQPGFDAALDSEARVWWCYDVNTMGFDVDTQFEALREISKGLQKADSSLVKMGIAFDGLDPAKEGNIELLSSISRDINSALLTSHYLGGPWPVGHISPHSALTTHSMHTKLSQPQPIIFSHSGFATPDDIAALATTNSFIAITPENEMSEGHGQASTLCCGSSDHQKLHQLSSLGTDTNWNISGDLLLQARLYLASVRNRSYEKTLTAGNNAIPNANPMDVIDAFHLATRQGGLALHREDVGVLKVGAVADIVAFNSGEEDDAPNMLGSFTDPIAAVVLHTNVGDVRDVLVGGEWRKREGRLLGARVLSSRGEDAGQGATWQWKDVAKKFREVARRVQEENAGKAPPIGEKFLGMREYAAVERY